MVLSHHAAHSITGSRSTGSKLNTRRERSRLVIYFLSAVLPIEYRVELPPLRHAASFNIQ